MSEASKYLTAAAVCVWLGFALDSQEVFVDGIRVISESGSKYEQKPEKSSLGSLVKVWPWRKKSDNYTLYVTADGIEVKLDSEVVWALSVA